MAEWVTVSTESELRPGDREVYDIDGYYVAVFNVGGAYYAFEDVCTHDDGPLAEGELDGYELECPRHGARFDIRTGAALTPPAVKATRRYEVRVENGDVQVLFEAD